MPGAIVSIDWADPPESWHWAGPRWRGQAPPDTEPGAVTGCTIAVEDPTATDQRWADVLDVDPADLGIRFAAAARTDTDGIVEITVDRPFAWDPFEIGTVRLAPAG